MWLFVGKPWENYTPNLDLSAFGCMKGTDYHALFRVFYFYHPLLTMTEVDDFQELERNLLVG